MSFTSSIRGLLLGRIHSTRSALKFRTNFDCRTRVVHSNVKLIFLAASILVQPPQRPSPEGNPVEETGPPHFLHLVGTIIITYFMMVSCVASYKEEARYLVLATNDQAAKSHEDLPVLLERLFKERRL